MAWKKSSERLVTTFDAALPRDPRIERRTMFGFPCAFVNRNMFAGLHEERLFVRLDRLGRERLISVHEARPFEPMAGRVMREYVVVPEVLIGNRQRLAGLMANALRYVAGLPVKQPTVGASKGANRAKRARPARPGRSRGGTAKVPRRSSTRRS